MLCRNLSAPQWVYLALEAQRPAEIELMKDRAVVNLQSIEVVQVETYIVMNVRIVTVVSQSSLKHVLRLFRSIQFDQNVPPIDVRLHEIRTHANSLPVQAVRLFQSRLILGYQIGQIHENAQMIRRYSRLIRFARFGARQQRLCFHIRQFRFLEHFQMVVRSTNIDMSANIVVLNLDGFLEKSQRFDVFAGVFQ